MGGGGNAFWKLKKAIAKAFAQICGSLCQTSQTCVVGYSTAASPVCHDSANSPMENQKRSVYCENVESEITEQGISRASPSSDMNLCAICLDPLNYRWSSSTGQAIFTAQCSHAFHFTCISSNVRHGSVICPICRAQWTQLPHNLNTRCLLHHKTDPALQMLDNSISNLWVQRQSFLHSARYDGDDQIELDPASDQPRLHVSLLDVPLRYPDFSSCLNFDALTDHSSRLSSMERRCPTDGRACLHIKLSQQLGIDLVLVASPSGPHLRLMRQAMALTVFSLRPTDRLAIVTYSSSATQVFRLRRMTSYSKRAALQVIDCLSYSGQADPTKGLRKGIKVLTDRLHKNPESYVLHLANNPSRSYHWFDASVPVPIHRFQVGYGFHSSNGLFSHKFEEFLASTLGGGVQDLQLTIGEERMVVDIGELRGGEERTIPVCISESGWVRVEYHYRDGEHIRRNEIVVEIGDERDTRNSAEVLFGARTSHAEIGTSMVPAWPDDGPSIYMATEY